LYDAASAASTERNGEMAKGKKAEKPNVFVRFYRYLGGVRSELKRVVWPTRSEVINSSMVVIVTLAFFIVFTLIVDTISTQFVDLVAQIGG
jgi:preprotein translocase subunit SecE